MKRGKTFHLFGRPMSLLMGTLLVVQFICGCNYARMRDDEATQTYESSMPQMPKSTIPIGSSSIQVLRETDPDTLLNPLTVDTPTVDRGKERYGFYCVHCHGMKADGNATVGQSFASLPTNLISPDVQQQSDGELFSKISLGFRRHPPLAATVSVEERWAIIIYMRSLAGRSNGSQG